MLKIKLCDSFISEKSFSMKNIFYPISALVFYWFIFFTIRYEINYFLWKKYHVNCLPGKKINARLIRLTGWWLASNAILGKHSCFFWGGGSRRLVCLWVCFVRFFLFFKPLFLNFHLLKCKRFTDCN